MYQEYIATVLAYIEALNAADKRITEQRLDDHMVPYLGRIPVVFEGELNGWLADEIGGAWSYQDATREEREAYKA